MAKRAYKTSYRRLDDTYGRVRRFWCTADTKFDTYDPSRGGTRCVYGYFIKEG